MGYDPADFAPDEAGYDEWLAKQPMPIEFRDLTTVAERVDAGIRWLDTRSDLGSWEWMITNTSIRMSDPCNCICGAIFGEEGDTRGSDENGFARAKAMLEAEGLQTVDLGFSSNGSPGDYTELKKEWVRRCKERS